MEICAKGRSAINVAAIAAASGCVFTIDLPLQRLEDRRGELAGVRVFPTSRVACGIPLLSLWRSIRIIPWWESLTSVQRKVVRMVGAAP